MLQTTVIFVFSAIPTMVVSERTVKCSTCRTGSLDHIRTLVEMYNTRNALPESRERGAIEWLLDFKMNGDTNPRFPHPFQNT